MISDIIIQLVESKSRIMDYKPGKLDFEINRWNQIHVWISIPVCANLNRLVESNLSLISIPAWAILKSTGGIKFEALDFDSSICDFEIN